MDKLKEWASLLAVAAAVCALAVSCPPRNAEAFANTAPLLQSRDKPGAECLHREISGLAPCGAAEQAAEDAAWAEYYGCDPRGCGFVDFDAHPELIGGAMVLEPAE